MFKEIQRRLAWICSLITSGIVCMILLFCLLVSEKNMRREEEAFFILKSNSLIFDLSSSRGIDAGWYAGAGEKGTDHIYIELNHVPSVLSTLLLTAEEQELVKKVAAYQESAPQKKLLSPSPEAARNLSRNQNSFIYRDSSGSYMVMSCRIARDSSFIDSLYIHSLKNFQRKITEQRICYLGIFAVSVLALFVFSRYFTAHAMKPLMENDLKQKQFVALASHELRSPLAVFKTGLSLLKGAPEPARTDRIHRMMHGEILRMERLLNDLLFLSRAEQAALQYDFARVNLSELLRGVCLKYQPSAAAKNITLSADREIPDALMWICDRQRIEQVLVILIDNALTYVPSGGTVSLGLEISRTAAVLSVTDNGPGISDSDKKKIFDRFYQANTAHSSKEHFGLGLSIAQEICLAHRGKISVSDAPGGGCVFTVRLPLSPS